MNDVQWMEENKKLREENARLRKLLLNEVEMLRLALLHLEKK